MKLDIREFKLHVYGKRQIQVANFYKKFYNFGGIQILYYWPFRIQDVWGGSCVFEKNSEKPSSKASRILIGFVLYGTHQCFQKFAENCRKGAGNFVHGFSSYHVRRLISVITQQVTCCCTKHMPIGTIWSLHSYAHCMTPSQLTCEQAPKPS